MHCTLLVWKGKTLANYTVDAEGDRKPFLPLVSINPPPPAHLTVTLTCEMQADMLKGLGNP